MTRGLAAALAAALLAAPATARAGDDGAVLALDATQLLPRDGVHAGATGLGAELRLLPRRDCMTASIGGFAVVGAPGTPRRRDVIDVHVQVGVKGRGAIAPYASLGLDLLHVTTHEAGRSARGTTLGVSAQLGLFARLSEGVVARATAGYLGAIVPGTGDDLGAVVLQVGLGVRVGD